MNIPSIGKTGKEVYQGWKKISEEPCLSRRVIYGIIPTEGVFAWRFGKIAKIFHYWNRDGSCLSTFREATEREIDDIHDAISKGMFQIEERMITGCLGVHPMANAGKTTKVIHQATGKRVEG